MGCVLAWLDVKECVGPEFQCNVVSIISIVPGTAEEVWTGVESYVAFVLHPPFFGYVPVKHTAKMGHFC